MSNLRLAIGMGLVLAASSFAWCDDWPGFRGPDGTGVAAGATPPTHWGADENIAWRVALPGSGNGSPIVVADRVLLNGAADFGRQRMLVCYRDSDGKQLWSRAVTVDNIELTHKSNPYCGSTPASNGRVVVVWHGTGGLHCYTLSGDRQWSRDFGEIRHLWGYASSPVICDDRVILLSGSSTELFIAAVRLSDGGIVWKTVEPGGGSNETPDGDMTGSWCTPVLTHHAAQDQLICAMPTRVVAYSAIDGHVLWTCDGLRSERGSLVYASPVVLNGVVTVMAGYRGPAFGIRLGGSGDVTETHRLWYTKTDTPQRIGSGVGVDGHIYVANADGGTIECLELATGRRCWRARVRGGPHWASTVLAGDLLYATNQSGITRVFKPNPSRFELLAENDLGETINATPAFSGASMFVRTSDHLYGISHVTEAAK